VFDDFEALNAHLLERCRKRLADRLRGHAGTIGERLEHDLAAFQKPLPAPYDACEKTPGSVSSLSLVRYRRNDYSVPTAFGHRKVLVRGYVHEVVITCGAEVIARHPRSYEREDFVFSPLHYLALIEQKTNAPARWGAQNLALAAYGRRGKPRRSPIGRCLKSLRRCGDFSRRAWVDGASASSFRFCG
jgi:hypothetical protein